MIALLLVIATAGRVAPMVPLPIEVATVYHAVPEQTDDTPLITADGTRIDPDNIGRIAAVSQELLWYNGGPIRYGDYLWVEIDNELRGLWRVHDTMWEGVDRYVDLLVDSHIEECWIAEGSAERHPYLKCLDGLTVYHIGGE